jgi:UDP-glucuronate 4-epimerase
MHLLITGSAGFIGTNLALDALAQGDRVTGVDNFHPFYPRALKVANVRDARAAGGTRFRFVEGDVRRAETWAELAAGEPVDAVVHLAGHSDLGGSLSDPVGYLSVNVDGTVQALEFCRRHSVGRFVFASSCMVYGADADVPLSESNPAIHPMSPYAVSKRTGEMLCHTYHSLYGIAATCLRFFSVYGPRQRPEMAIPRFMRAIRSGEEIPLFGRGEMVRDYCHVDDVVSGVRKALALPPGLAVYNIGSAGPVRTLDLVRELEEALGGKARVVLLPGRPGELDVNYASIEKARRELGYEPRYTLATGVRHVVAWYLDNEEQIRLALGSVGCS